MSVAEKVSPPQSKSGLRTSYLSFTEVLAQSIASIAPSATPALVIPLVFATAGNGTWLAYLFATLAIALVGANLNQFTRRSASPGSLYSFIVKGLGPNVGVLSGWALVLAYLLTASAVLCGFINYANELFHYANITVPAIIIGIIGAAIAWYVAIKDIKLSANLMLAFEAISLVLIFILAIVVLVKHNFEIDSSQWTLQDVSPDSIRIGLVLAFFSFVGFESATSLGDEAQKPLRSIPRVVTISAIFVGVFFVLLSYTQVLGFEGNATKLNESAAPLADLATLNGVEFFGPLINIGALVSFWACFLACTNAGARILFSMGRHGIFHSSVGQAHENNKTPHIAITISTILALVIPVILIAFGAGLFEIYGWVGTIATFGFLLCYALISISAPVYLYREKELKKRHIVLSVVTVLILLIPIVGSVYPLPAYPYGLFPFIFVGWLVLGAIWFGIKRSRSPEVASDIESNLEVLHQHFREARAKGLSEN
jgi:amino acid transporter